MSWDVRLLKDHAWLPRSGQQVAASTATTIPSTNTTSPTGMRIGPALCASWLMVCTSASLQCSQWPMSIAPMGMNLGRGHYELAVDAAPLFRLVTAFDELRPAV